MLTAAARTHTGRVRANNEDALVCRPAEGLFAVVDGMGGEAAGEVAAAITAEALAAVPNQRRQAGEALLGAAFRAARGRILAESARTPAHANLGAVATAVRLEDDGRHVTVAHVGDTRAYRVDRHGITQLTHDHVGAPSAPGKKAAVSRDLGRADLPEPWLDTVRVAVQPGDLLVLCTDGLYDPIKQEELAEELTRLWSGKVAVEEAANKLVGLALARGGPDNVTVVVVRVARWRRRGGVRRLGAPAAVGLFALVGALALGAGLWRNRHLPPLPDEVRRSTHVSEPELIVLPGVAHTRVAARQTLQLRGVLVSAEAWTIDLADGAILDLSLAAISLEGPLTVNLGPGAHVSLHDARVGATTITLSGGGSVSCRDSFLRTTAGDWTVDPGLVLDLRGCRAGTRTAPDTVLLGPAADAPAAGAADPAPTADPAGPTPAAPEAPRR